MNKHDAVTSSVSQALSLHASYSFKFDFRILGDNLFRSARVLDASASHTRLFLFSLLVVIRAVSKLTRPKKEKDLVFSSTWPTRLSGAVSSS